MRQMLSTVITQVRTMEIDEVNNHIIAGGYLITGLACEGHNTLIMTAVYLWAGIAHTNTLRHLRLLHLSTFLPHSLRLERGHATRNQQLAPA